MAVIAKVPALPELVRSGISPVNGRLRLLHRASFTSRRVLWVAATRSRSGLQYVREVGLMRPRWMAPVLFVPAVLALCCAYAQVSIETRQKPSQGEAARIRPTLRTDTNLVLVPVSV